MSFRNNGLIYKILESFSTTLNTVVKGKRTEIYRLLRVYRLRLPFPVITGEYCSSDLHPRKSKPRPEVNISWVRKKRTGETLEVE